MQTPKLTIGIPTYNGSPLICNTLDSVLNQVPNELRSRLDILILDNASTDATGEIARSYQKAPIIPIHYHRNESNIGFDRNVDTLFKKARGQYVWILADDDVLYEGALIHVLNLLDQYPKLKAIQVNYDKYDYPLQQIIHQVAIAEDKYCEDSESFLLNSEGRYGAVSTLILDKDAWNREELSGGVGTGIMHMYGLLKVLRAGDSYIVRQSLVKARAGSTKAVTDGDSLLHTALSSGTLCHLMTKMGYGSHIVQWHLKKDRRYAYNAILLAKIRGIKNKSAAIKELVSIHNSLELWLIWIPIILLPDILFPRSAIRGGINVAKGIRNNFR